MGHKPITIHPHGDIRPKTIHWGGSPTQGRLDPSPRQSHEGRQGGSAEDTCNGGDRHLAEKIKSKDTAMGQGQAARERRCLGTSIRRQHRWGATSAVTRPPPGDTSPCPGMFTGTWVGNTRDSVIFGGLRTEGRENGRLGKG